MSMNVTTVNTVNDISLDTFVNGKSVISKLEGGQIRVGGKTFAVSFGEDGKAKVSWAHTSFWHLFQGNAKTAVTNKVQELYDAFRSQSAARDFASMKTSIVGMNKLTTMPEQAMNRIGGKFAEITELTDVAHYGFDTMRFKAQAGIISGFNAGQVDKEKGEVNLSVINEYNLGIGILPKTLDAEGCVMVMQKLNRGLTERDVSVRSGGYTKEKLVSWANFLKGKDLDIFTKLQKAETEATNGKTTGWAGVINARGIERAALELVRKNLDWGLAREPEVNYVLEGVAKTLVALSRVDRTTIGENDWKKLVTDTLAANVPGGKLNLAKDVLDHVSTTAFFRQTSKLGLDFFKANDIPIMFDWADHAGNDLTANEAPINDKWWKDPNEALDRHYGASITFSEMRHVKKMEQAGQLKEGSTLLRVAGLREDDLARKFEAQRTMFAAMDPNELKDAVQGMKSAFDAKTLPAVKPMLEHFMISTSYRNTFADMTGSGAITLNERGLRVAERALEQTKADYERLTDDVNRALFLLSFATHLQSNFYAQMVAIDPDDCDSYDMVEEVPVVQRRLESAELFAHGASGLEKSLAQSLAGTDGGHGMSLFFFGNGTLNGLGQNLVTTLRKELAAEYAELEGAAKNDFLDTLSETIRTRLDARLGDLADAFAAEFGLADRTAALDHPAFGSILYRAVGERDSLEQIRQMLPIVRHAYELSILAKNVLNQEITRLPEAVRGPLADIVRSKLEWDMNRICFKLAQKGEKNANVRVLQRAQTLVKFALKAHQMTERIAANLHVELTAKQYRDLVNGYLERASSAVHNARLQDDVKYDTTDVEADDAVATKIIDKIVDTIALKGLPANAVIGGIGEAFHNGLKPKLVERCFALLSELQNAQIQVTGRTPKARVTALIHELARSLQTVFEEVNSDHDLMADELGPMLAFCCAAYLDRHPNLVKDVAAVSFEEAQDITAEIAQEVYDSGDPLLQACNFAILGQD